MIALALSVVAAKVVEYLVEIALALSVVAVKVEEYLVGIDLSVVAAKVVEYLVEIALVLSVVAAKVVEYLVEIALALSVVVAKVEEYLVRIDLSVVAAKVVEYLVEIGLALSVVAAKVEEYLVGIDLSVVAAKVVEYLVEIALALSVVAVKVEEYLVEIGLALSVVAAKVEEYLVGIDLSVVAAKVVEYLVEIGLALSVVAAKVEEYLVGIDLSVVAAKVVEYLVEIALYVAAKVWECLVAPIARPFRYIWNYKTNFDNFKAEETWIPSHRDYDAFESRRSTLKEILDALSDPEVNMVFDLSPEMATSTTKHEVEKFDGTNDFAVWKMKMSALLGNLGLDEALEGEDKMPSTYTEEKKKDIMKRAFNTLILSLSDKVLREIAKMKTAAEVWLKLESLYMTKSLSSRLYLKGRFFTFKMQDGKNLQDHIDEFNKLCLDLENIQIEYEDEDKALVLLHSLPKSYENFVDILKHGRETLSLEDVISALNSKDFQRKCEMKEQSGESLIVRGRTDKRDQKSRGKSRSKSRGGHKKSIKCYYCHEEGHIRKFCTKRKKGGK
ncbi:hypothetical protein LWI29_007194 [Acer saccharum]|uniref:CCHC-type domain-containing protein n=1 Tax=Acer saccharum TaxID=4024 RepID=A0AA39W258_ACESA|nr:hypothetical protein LWI29_007194 [Acer saccharum]